MEETVTAATAAVTATADVEGGGESLVPEGRSKIITLPVPRQGSLVLKLYA